jgi:hypothetical protein
MFMKYSLTFLLSLVLFITALAQTRIVTVEYAKVNRQAVVNDIPFPEKTVRDAIDNKMEQMGYKGKDAKGFTVYRGVRLPALGTELYDLYFSADRKSRKDKDNSSLTLIISKGFDNFVADSTDTRLMGNAKGYLDSIKITIAAYDLEQQIVAQEDAVKKADKKYSNLIDDAASLEKKRKSIEKDIEDNKKDQANQQNELSKERQILETLRAKRKQ